MQIPRKNAALYKKNKRFFEKNIPHLSGIVSADLPKNIRIDFTDGDVDLYINENRFYGIDAVAYAEQQVARYVMNPSRIEVAAPGADEERTPTHLRIFKKFEKSLAKAGILVSHDPVRVDTATTFVFGLGLGQHLYRLIADTRCREIIICEPEPSFFHASLYCLDWSQLFKLMKNRIALVLERDEKAAFSYIRWHVNAKNPGVQQVIYHMKHYSADYLDAVYKEFIENTSLFFDGLGFYDDERLMTRNHLHNVYKNVWKICNPVSTPLNMPAVVVGSGPSLNEDINWLKENQENIFIFSGGSSLQVLLKNNIIPDFHCEIENIPMNYELLKPLVDDYFLEDTVLISSSTMDTRSAYLFPKRMWFMREAVMPSTLHGTGIRTIDWQNPTVVNTALSAALTLGFRRVLLLGADFGTRDAAVHHSKDTAYETNEELKKVEYRFPEKTKGNFGGVVYTSQHFLTAMRSLDNLIQDFRGASVFNGSDGSFLKRAIPMRSKRFTVEAIPNSKKSYSEAIYKFSQSIDWEEKLGSELFDDMKKDFSKYIDFLREKYREASKKHKDIIVMMMEFHQSVHESTDDLSKYNPMLIGSMVNHTVLMMYWWRRAHEDHLKDYERLMRKQWRVFFREIEEDFLGLIEAIRQDLPLVRPDLFSDKNAESPQKDHIVQC